MEDIKEFTEAKSKPVTSHTKRSRQASNAGQSTKDGAERLTAQKAVTSEKIVELLARMKDVTHTWPIKQEDGKMPAPFISNRFIIFAFPIDGHVIKNTFTSEGTQNFEVDGILVIPVTSEVK